ncbi:MAG: DUF3794 domain-containing protein [Clostridia bacterium]|nr:DUF3794 domain-containing protein [Clostridia bacterium]
MNFEMKKEKLRVKECAEKTKAEQSLEAQINLPDYCAEIKRILKCTITPGIHSVGRTGDRVSARGTVLIRVIYLGEGDKLDCYEKSLDLAVGSQMKSITDDMVLTARANVSYVNCRAASQRKITVGGAVSVEFTAFQIKEKELPCEILNASVQTRTRKVKAENLVCMSEKTFDMGETVALPKEKPSIARVLRQNSYVVIESKKAVSGKLLIKGECITEIVYCPQESENKLEEFRHSMPLSQIIDVEGIGEDMECSVRCNPSQLIVNVKNDSDDSGRLVEFALRITAGVSCSTVKEYELIQDCYCTEGEIDAEYTLTDILCPVNSLEKTETVKESLDVNGAKEICDVWISDVKTQMNGESDKAKGKCTVTACVLYLDEKDAPSYMERELEFFSEVSLNGKYESVECDFEALVKKLECTFLQKGKAEIRLEVAVAVRICSVNSYRIVTDASESRSQSEKKQRPALTLYFCSEGERVWDIAKKYGTTCEAITGENGIEGECVKEEGMLLIPCV